MSELRGACLSSTVHCAVMQVPLQIRDKLEPAPEIPGNWASVKGNWAFVARLMADPHLSSRSSEVEGGDGCIYRGLDQAIDSPRAVWNQGSARDGFKVATKNRAMNDDLPFFSVEGVMLMLMLTD